MTTTINKLYVFAGTKTMCATTGHGRATTGEFFCYNHVRISCDLGRELQQLMLLLLPGVVVCYMLHDLAVTFHDGGDVFATTAAGFCFIRLWISCNPLRLHGGSLQLCFSFATTGEDFCYIHAFSTAVLQTR